VLEKATTDEGRTIVRVRVDPTKEGLVRAKFGPLVRARARRARAAQAR
jgi:hypothetical protein